MSKLKLDEIGDWANKQKELYAKYFEELSKVKNAISTYQTVKDIISKQSQLVKEYSRAFNLSKQDKNFTQQEIDYMQQVYSGILEESLKKHRPASNGYYNLYYSNDRCQTIGNN